MARGIFALQQANVGLLPLSQIACVVGLFKEHVDALNLSPHDKAANYTHNVAQQRPEHFGAHRQLCARLAQAGRIEEARAALELPRGEHSEPVAELTLPTVRQLPLGRRMTPT